MPAGTGHLAVTAAGGVCPPAVGTLLSQRQEVCAGFRVSFISPVIAMFSASLLPLSGRVERRWATENCTPRGQTSLS